MSKLIKTDVPNVPSFRFVIGGFTNVPFLLQFRGQG